MTRIGLPFSTLSAPNPRGSDRRGSDRRGSDRRGSDPRGSEPRGSDPHRRATSLARMAARTVALLAGLAGCTVDPAGWEALWLESGLSASARAEAAARCCACLASSEASAATLADDAPDPIAACGATGADEEEALAPRCLCAPAAERCEATLLEGSAVSLWGACTQIGGVCEAPCRGVLAYPEN